MEIFADIIGTAGVALILVAYFLVQSGRKTANDLIFPILNLIGASLLMISLMVHWNTPSVIIEIFWIAISLYGIAKILKSRR